ncbi:MAG: hypothetical protein ACT4O2_09580 [Beijerinckiaceae bacterium]
MKAIILGVAAIVAAAFPNIGARAEQKTANEENAVPIPPDNWLFLQNADSMTSQVTTLTLQGVAPPTRMFTDRPERMTGDAPTAKFVSFWTSGKSDFEKDPPNATLSVNVDGQNHLSVVELIKPQLKEDTLTYTVKVLSDAPPPSGEAATLFIDWWYGPGWGPRPFWGPGPWGRWGGGACWRGPWGGLHCRPAWAW